MADSTRVRGSIAGDCEGAGERGERGKRGHRGPPGRDANAVPTPPFAITTTTIYARPASQGGSDKHGKGTLDEPFETFQQAMRFVPNVIPPGETFVVDITGIGVETLPADYQVPAIQGTYLGGVEAPNPFLFQRPLCIRAFPQLVAAIPSAEAIITPSSGFTRGVGPNALLIDITVPGVRPSWAGGALKGKQLIRTGGGGPSQLAQTTCCIYDSVDDDGSGNAVLSVCNRVAFIVDAATLGAGPTPGEYQIVEPSATLEGPPPNFFDFCVFNVANVVTPALQGLRIRCTVPGAANSIQIANTDQPFVELCDLPDGIFATGAGEQWAMFSTFLGGGIGSTEGNVFTGRRSYIRNANFFAFGGPYNEFFNSVFEGCVSITNDQFPSGAAPLNFGLRNCLIDGSVSSPDFPSGNGIDSLGGGVINLIDVTIKNCAGDGVNLHGVSQGNFSNLTGSGNGGFGVVADDGAHVVVDAATTIGNADGRAYTNGGVPVAVWPGGTFNDTNLTTLSRVSEP